MSSRDYWLWSKQRWWWNKRRIEQKELAWDLSHSYTLPLTDVPHEMVDYVEAVDAAYEYWHEHDCNSSCSPVVSDRVNRMLDDAEAKIEQHRVRTDTHLRLMRHVYFAEGVTCGFLADGHPYPLAVPADNEREDSFRDEMVFASARAWGNARFAEREREGRRIHMPPDVRRGFNYWKSVKGLRALLTSDPEAVARADNYGRKPSDTSDGAATAESSGSADSTP